MGIQLFFLIGLRKKVTRFNTYKRAVMKPNRLRRWQCWEMRRCSYHIRQQSGIRRGRSCRDSTAPGSVHIPLSGRRRRSWYHCAKMVPILSLDKKEKKRSCCLAFTARCRWWLITSACLRWSFAWNQRTRHLAAVHDSHCSRCGRAGRVRITPSR